jgi:arsenate reductase (glutaredoxin)
LKLEIYTLKTCDTCRKAVKWLRENNFPFEEIPIRDQPPTLPKLRLALQGAGGDIRKLFNTSGQDYRALNLKDTLPTMPEAEALALLASNGNLIKRPFLIKADLALTGFNPQKWSNFLAPDLG